MLSGVQESVYGKTEDGELLDQADGEADTWRRKPWMTIRNHVRQRDHSSYAQEPAAPRIVFGGDERDEPESPERAVGTRHKWTTSRGKNECGKTHLQ